MPTKPFHAIETFMKAANSDIGKAPVEAVPRDNLTWSEQKALNDLQQIDNIIIIEAKGRAVVIWNTDDYIDDTSRQLNKTSSYKKLENDPTESYVETI